MGLGGKAKAKPHAENQTLYDFTENVYDRRRSDPGGHDYSLRLGDDRAERSVSHRQQPADEHDDGNPDVKEYRPAVFLGRGNGNVCRGDEEAG